LQRSDLLIALFELVLVVFSLCAHEWAHAWMASRHGDNTGLSLGRLSLNPMVHVDTIGSLLLPALMILSAFFAPIIFGGLIFGWAKPVPVVRRNLRNFDRDDTLISLAGPAVNLAIAIAAILAMVVLLLIEHPMHMTENPPFAVMMVQIFFYLAFQINLTLCLFNLIPFPPLDGSRLLRHFLHYDAIEALDKLSGPISYLIILIVGRLVLGTLLHPIFKLLDMALAHI
jgi:Zn-dependent protease